MFNWKCIWVSQCGSATLCSLHLYYHNDDSVLFSPTLFFPILSQPFVFMLSLLLCYLSFHRPIFHQLVVSSSILRLLCHPLTTSLLFPTFTYLPADIVLGCWLLCNSYFLYSQVREIKIAVLYKGRTMSFVLLRWHRLVKQSWWVLTKCITKSFYFNRLCVLNLPNTYKRISVML